MTRYDPLIGSSIDDAAKCAVEVAKAAKSEIILRFNSVKFKVFPDDSPKDIVHLYGVFNKRMVTKNQEDF